MTELYVPDNLERCQDHPNADVRHIYDADFYVLNGERAGCGINRRTVRYECADCRRELATKAKGMMDG